MKKRENDLTTMQKDNVIKAIIYLIGCIATAIAIAFGCQSCKALRTISTRTEVVQKADTMAVNHVITETYTSKKIK